jgi:hypothetical protein
MKTKRPLAVSIISWLTVISGILSLLQTASGARPSMVGPVLAASGIVITGLQIVSGLWMLKGSRDARTLYVATLAAATALTCVIFSSQGKTGYLLLVLIFNVIVTYYLYRPGASEFFMKKVR